MKPLTFPVSRLTRAMLIRQYGPEPILLDRSDIRRRELMHTGPSSKHLERKQYSLNSSITLLLNKHDYDHAAGRTAEIGYYLYNADKQRIFLFVWARVKAGLPALQSIYDYYELHGIEEDDFAIETAERLWKRWREKKGKEVMYFTPQFVPRNTSLLLAERQAEEVIERMTNIIKAEETNIDPRHAHTVAPWVLHRLTPLRQREIAKILNRDQRLISRSANSFDQYLACNPSLRKWLAYCLKTTKAEPTPSATS